MPERLAILSDKQGAALQDVLRTLHQRYPLVARDIYPVPVQGRDGISFLCIALKRPSLSKACFNSLKRR